MLNKFKMLLLSLTSLFIFAAPIAVAVPAYAITQDEINQNLCAGSNGVPGTDCPTNNDSDVQKLIKTILNILSFVVGVVSVIMIIVGGFRYVTSGGKQESVVAATNTIHYALIGLVIVALSQLIVHFVLNQTTAATT